MKSIEGELSKRKAFIDYLRIVAIICVVICHTVEGVYTHNVEQLEMLSNFSNAFRITSFSLGRTFGVPFFLMISGYLLLNRTYDGKNTKNFYTKNWLHLIICTVIWFAIYDVYTIFIYENSITVLGFAKDILLLQKPYLSHQWYMPMIIGFYAAIPFVANALKRDDILRFITIPCIMVFIYGSLVPFANIMLSLFGKKMLTGQINMGFTGGIFGLYIIVGALIEKRAFKSIKTKMLICASILSFVVQIVIIYSFYRSDYIIWYDSPFVIITSICAFEIASRTIKWKSNRMTLFLARHSFAVYLIHMMIRGLPVVRHAIEGFSKEVQSMLLLLIVLTASYLIAWIIGKTRIGKYILYIK